MFKPIDTSNDRIVALDAIGTLTDQDYTQTLVPLVDHQLAGGKTGVMLLRFGPDFVGYAAHDLWDQGIFGLHHWNDFHRIAILSDHDWITSGLRIFSTLFPGQLRIYSADDLEHAITWLEGD